MIDASEQLEAASTPQGFCPRCRYAITDLNRPCPECGLDAVALRTTILQQSGIPYRPWLHRFAILFVLATFVLIVLGGTVTSKGAGLAVPDWPTTFEYNMFLFPPNMWVGNIFWEHTHRLMGSLVGLLAIVMCVWLWQTNTRDEIDGDVSSSFSDGEGESPRTPVRGSVRGWLRWLGVAALVLVIFQGVMGGLRVTQLSTWLAVFHGMTAQVFFCITVLIAAATSRWWIEGGESRKAEKQENRKAKNQSAIPNPQSEIPNPQSLHRPALLALIALFIQLALGATVRHHGAGLAIPDFPLSYGRLVPPLTQGEIENAMIAFADSPDSYATSDHAWYTPFHVAIHWSHRLFAIVVVAALAHLIAKVLRYAGGETKLKRPALALIAMIIAQVALGATTIWSTRHPEVATAHQTLGAILLATTALLFFRISRLRLRDEQQVTAESPRANRSTSAPGTQRPARATQQKTQSIVSTSPLLPEGAGT